MGCSPQQYGRDASPALPSGGGEEATHGNRIDEEIETRRAAATIHSYTVSLRAQLKGKVEIIELAPHGGANRADARPIGPPRLYAAR
jgi:hypothetical protein